MTLGCAEPPMVPSSSAERRKGLLWLSPRAGNISHWDAFRNYLH